MLKMANVQDQYEVVQPIGSGSFGQVFLVLHRLEQRYYVMKEITSLSTMDDKQRESTQQEVQLLSTMTHPNIVGYRDSFVTSTGNLAIFMEYCEQGDMHTYLQDAKKTGKMPGETRVLEWFVQIVLALHALHMRKILHRDLKTQNIFLTGSKVHQAFALKLGDFGIAKVLNSTTELAMTQIGTPFFMSPEVFNNKPYGYKSDVWGLGCVLYEVINGQRPFDAQSINGLAMKVLQGRYTPITASCTEETKWLIKCMLSMNPSHRPTLQEVLHAPSIRRSIKSAVHMVISVVIPEAKAQTELALTDQITSLGLGALVNSAPAAGPRRDRRQIMQRLERAERRRKREEDTLRRLQETASLLAQCLVENPQQNQNPAVSHLNLLTTRPPDLDASEEIEFLPQSSRQAGGPGSARGAEIEPLPLGDGLNVDDPYPPLMSHRDRVLLRKERRREEEQQKFEEEARKIREENLAYQRAWVQHREQRSRSPTKDQQHMSQHSLNLPQLSLAGSMSHAPSLPFDHVNSESSMRPFQSHHPHAMSSPRGTRQRFDSEPLPPRPQFGHQQPPPPNAVPHHTSGRWSHINSHAVPPIHTSRSFHSVCLDALSSDGFHLPEHSEDSGPEGSGNHSEDGLSGVDDRSFGNDEQVRKHSVMVQKRIDACRAAIHRHKMTIETLQYTFAEDGHGQDASEQHPMTLSSVPPYGTVYSTDHPHSHHRTGSEFGHDAGGSMHESRYRSSGTPPIVLDRIARLKRRCMEGLGNERFQAARQSLQNLLDAGAFAEAVRSEMLEKLGLDKIGFYSLIDQIVYMECKWGHIDASPPELA